MKKYILNKFILIQFILLGFTSSVIGQADIPFFYDSNWGYLSMSNGNLTSNNADYYNLRAEHRLDATGDYVKLNVKTIQNGTFSVKLIAKVGSGSWTGTITLDVSEDDISWTNLETITTIGNNSTSITPSVSIPNNTNYIRVYFANKVSGSNIGVDDFNVTSTLPVTFTGFDVKPYNNNVLVSFSTASEQNNAHFEIERSQDGVNFNLAGYIKGSGNSLTAQHYRFVDEQPYNGISYYRIKQVDFDGKSSYTKIRNVRIESNILKISPRNTDGRIDINTNDTSYDVNVYNIRGQKVYHFPTLFGTQSIFIDHLKPGLYFIEVNGIGFREIAKVVKF